MRYLGLRGGKKRQREQERVRETPAAEAFAEPSISNRCEKIKYNERKRQRRVLTMRCRQCNRSSGSSRQATAGKIVRRCQREWRCARLMRLQSPHYRATILAHGAKSDQAREMHFFIKMQLPLVVSYIFDYFLLLSGIQAIVFRKQTRIAFQIFENQAVKANAWTQIILKQNAKKNLYP